VSQSTKRSRWVSTSTKNRAVSGFGAGAVLALRFEPKFHSLALNGSSHPVPEDRAQASFASLWTISKNDLLPACGNVIPNGRRVP